MHKPQVSPGTFTQRVHDYAQLSTPPLPLSSKAPLCMHEQSMNHISLKIGLDVMQSHPLHRTHFSCQPNYAR